MEKFWVCAVIDAAMYRVISFDSRVLQEYVGIAWHRCNLCLYSDNAACQSFYFFAFSICDAFSDVCRYRYNTDNALYLCCLGRDGSSCTGGDSKYQDKEGVRMNFLSLLGVEFKKIKRTKIFLILFAATVILWIPSILHADLNFGMQAEGISPENNFFIQGFMGMSWFLFPASMVVGTVLLGQTERTNKGILKMLALPVNTWKLCMAKFVVLLVLAAALILMMTGMYYISAAVCTAVREYTFLLPPLYVVKEIACLFLSAIPMIAFFWMLSVCIHTPIFSVSIGLASIVPSVLMISTKAWFVYPMDYPFFVITAEYGKLASNLTTAQVEFIPWIPVAVTITIVCLSISCIRFGQSERRL